MGRKRRSFLAPKRNRFRRLNASITHKEELKSRGNLRCEVCGWSDPNFEPYYMIEIHHIRPRSCNGEDRGHNFIALCPVHHRIADRISRSRPSITRDDLIADIGAHGGQR